MSRPPVLSSLIESIPNVEGIAARQRLKCVTRYCRVCENGIWRFLWPAGVVRARMRLQSVMHLSLACADVRPSPRQRSRLCLRVWRGAWGGGIGAKGYRGCGMRGQAVTGRAHMPPSKRRQTHQSFFTKSRALVNLTHTHTRRRNIGIWATRTLVPN